MALLDSEVYRIKAELGFNVLAAGAEPYISIHAVFNRVIQAYMTSGASTTSTTSVTAATSATPATLTLASATGFSSFARVVVDVDDRQEVAQVQSVSGSTITLLLKKAHSGTYPVTEEGGESIIRNILRKLDQFSRADGYYETAATRMGIKALVGDVEFFGTGAGGSGDTLERTKALQTFWRNELANACGLGEWYRALRGGGSGMISY